MSEAAELSFEAAASFLDITEDALQRKVDGQRIATLKPQRRPKTGRFSVVELERYRSELDGNRGNVAMQVYKPTSAPLANLQEAPPPPTKPSPVPVHEQFVLTVDECRIFARCSRKDIVEAIEQELLPFYRVGRGRRVLREDLEQYLRTLPKRKAATQ